MKGHMLSVHGQKLYVLANNSGACPEISERKGQTLNSGKGKGVGERYLLFI